MVIGGQKAECPAVEGKTRMLVFTSYFAMTSKLPDYIVPIAISGWVPNFWGERPRAKFLAPKKWFFDEWKKNHDNDFYIRNFESEVLSNLDPLKVVEWLYATANKTESGKIPRMMCYERAESFCHRHLVADWLNKTIPNVVDCREYIFNRKRNDKTI